MKNRVSVIIPCYNHEAYIQHAIDSALEQTYVPSTLVVIDDGSSDNSWKIVCDLVGENPEREQFLGTLRFHATTKDSVNLVGIKQKNAGPSKARNVGIQSVFGITEVFAFLDADDFYHPTKIKKSVEIMESMPQAGLVYTDYISLNTKTKEGVREFKEPFNIRSMGSNNIVSTNSIVSKNALAKVGGFNENLRVCEDYDLWLRISENFAVYHIPEPLFTYRITGEGASQTVNSDEWSRCLSQVHQAAQQRRENNNA
jgi:glycosyltransferase involved in cell wall biosynthesis